MIVRIYQLHFVSVCNAVLLAKCKYDRGRTKSDSFGEYQKVPKRAVYAGNTRGKNRRFEPKHKRRGGKRRFPRIDSLVKIADALNVEVYQLFIPEQKEQIVFEETPEIDLIRRQLNSELICNFRKSMNRFLDKIEDSF